MKTRIVAYLPVRGGSKGIPGKNIKMMAGKPLLHWAALACIESEAVNEVVVATDSEEIEAAARQLKYEKLSIFRRSSENCTDTASTESAMLEFAGARDNFTHIMLVQATSPLIQSLHLDEAVAHYFRSGADSLIALVRQLKFVWEERDNGMVTPGNYNPQDRPMRQNFDGILTEPGAFYITGRNSLLQTECRISGSMAAYELPEECYWDIDTMAEWRIIEEILRSRQADHDKE